MQVDTFILLLDQIRKHIFISVFRKKKTIEGFQIDQMF